MKCLCPKCKTDIINESPEIPDEGIFLECPECKTTFNIKKESFTRRSLYKNSEISCSECSSEPGSTIYCQNCHAIYPDFLVTESSSAAKKQFGKIFGLLKAFNRISVKKPNSIAASQAPQKQIAIKGIKLPGQLTLYLTLLILVLLIGGSGVYYYLDKIESAYVNDYIAALYVIKTAEDYNNKICEKISNDWKTTPSAATISLTAAEKTFLSRGVKDTELVVKNLSNPSKKYLASYDALTKLLEIYKKHQALTAIPTGTPESFGTSARNLSDEFRKHATVLKAALPKKLAEKLSASKAKLKELQNF
jgi:hypothetical protein